MTKEIEQVAADKLLRCVNLISDRKILPKIFIVGEETYWFYNAARRAAYGTNLTIESLTADDAWKIVHGEQSSIKHSKVAWDFDQRGEVFGNFLFCDNPVLLKQ